MQELARPHILRRASITSLSFSLQQKINFIANIDTRKEPSKTRRLEIRREVLKKGRNVVIVSIERIVLESTDATHQYARTYHQNNFNLPSMS